MVTPMLEDGCKVSVTRGYVWSEFDRYPATMWTQVLKSCLVFFLVHDIMEAWFMAQTRVGAVCNVGCVGQKKKHCVYLWTEHIFVVCLSSKETSSNLGDRVAACNHSWSIDLWESERWEMQCGRNLHVATRNKMCLHDWNQSGQLHDMWADRVIESRYEFPVEPSISSYNNMLGTGFHDIIKWLSTRAGESTWFNSMYCNHFCLEREEGGKMGWRRYVNIQSRVWIKSEKFNVHAKIWVFRCMGQNWDVQDAW